MRKCGMPADSGGIGKSKPSGAVQSKEATDLSPRQNDTGAWRATKIRIREKVGRIMMKEKQYETIRVFFKIKDSEIHGGEDGYAEAEICLRANDLKNFRLQEYTEETAAFFAGLCKVPRENVEVIEKQEHESNAKES